nr:uncharacterized mitochondrial protein AtMg00810-like [Tanacetum cinerariifolium]
MLLTNLEFNCILDMVILMFHQTLFIKKQKGDILLVQIYVDDIIFGATNKDLCKSFEKLMKDKFQMSSMGELTFFLGLQVKQKEDGIFINQDKYVAEILKKFGLNEGKLASTPIDTKKPLLKDPDGEDVDVHIYRSMISSLMYLTSSRPDIMFAVCACAHFQVTPKVSHLYAVKRIFRYLKGKPNLGLWYPKDSPFNLVAYSNSDYAGASLDRKSTTGGCQFLGSRLISWQCKKQTVVATSSVLWIQNQMLDYGLQALVDKKKVVVSEAAIRDALHLDDAERVDFLPNEEIFTELARMGYEKPTIKLTFYKAFFSSQWKFINLIIQNQLGDLSNHSTKYISPALTQKIFANMRRVGKGCSGVETPLFEGMLVARVPEEQGDVEEQGNEEEQGNADTTAEEPETAVPEDALRRLRKVRTSQRVDTSNDTLMEDVSNQGRVIDRDEDAVNEADEVREYTADTQVEGRQADIYNIDMDHAAKVLSMQEEELEVQEAVEVVTTAKLITEVVAAVSETVSAAVVIPSAVPETISVAAAVPTDPEEESSAKTPTETTSKDKGKGILVEEPKPMKKKQQVELDEAYARKLQEEINQDIDWEVAMDHVKQKAKEEHFIQRYQVMKKRPQTEAQARRNMIIQIQCKMEFLLKSKEQMEEEESRAIALINQTPAQKAAKRRKLIKESKEAESIKQHLQIVPDEDDDVFTEATPLARKVPVVDYQIILLVERRYPLTKFTLEQMLNVVRLQVEEESEMSLELIRFTRQQLQEAQHN